MYEAVLARALPAACVLMARDRQSYPRCSWPEIANHSPEITKHSPEIANHSTEIANYSTEIANYSPEIANHSPEIAKSSARCASRVARCISLKHGFSSIWPLLMAARRTPSMPTDVHRPEVSPSSIRSSLRRARWPSSSVNSPMSAVCLSTSAKLNAKQAAGQQA